MSKPPGKTVASSPRKAPRRPAEVVTKFSFVKSYNIVDKKQNPLVSGDLEDIEAGAEKANQRGEQLLHIDLHDLVTAKKVFESERADDDEDADGELTLPQFISAFDRLVGIEMRTQLGYLFMKIDCNCDGRVSWNELLTYVMSQDRNGHKPELQEMELLRAKIPDCPSDEAHHQPAVAAVFIPKCGAYFSGGQDGTLRVWSRGLRLHRTLQVSSIKANVAVKAIALLPDKIMKVAVASIDRVISFYELQDLMGNNGRWSVWGRVQLTEMPISLEAFIHTPDKAHCLAIGTDAGTVPIVDVKTLLHLLKDDHVKEEHEARGGIIPFRVVQQEVVIITLPLHSKDVFQLTYDPTVSALASSGLDSMLHITQLDWPPAAVPSSKAASDSTQILRTADSAYCRSMCSIRAHPRGVISFQLMNVGNRRLCATCGYERSPCVWSIETGDLLRTLVGHHEPMRQVAYDPTTQVLVTLDSGGEMRTWEMKTFGQLQIIRPDDALQKISSVVYSPGQECILSTTRRLALWQHPRQAVTEENEMLINNSLLAPKGHSHPLVSVLYSDQFFLAVSGDESGLICVWDVRTGRQAYQFDHGSPLTTMELDCTGRKLLTGGANGEVTLWNFSNGEKLKTISHDEAPEMEVTGLVHVQVPKLSYYISVGWSREVWLWPDRLIEMEHAEPRHLGGHSEDILCVTFCPPNLIISGAYDGALIVHNIESGAGGGTRVPPRRHHVPDGGPADFVHSVAIETLAVIDPERQVLPDSVLVCGTADGYLTLYSLSNMHLLDEVRACSPGEGIQHLCTEQSSTLLVTGDSGGRIKVWDVSELPSRWPQGRLTGRDPSGDSLSQLYSWHAHTKAICHVEYLVGIEGVISASYDCTVRLWTLSGEQVGVFGQSDTWNLTTRKTWLDDHCYALEKGESDDKVLATERRLRALLSASKKPPPRPTEMQRTKDEWGAGGSAYTAPLDKRLYRVAAPQLEEIARLGNILGRAAPSRAADAVGGGKAAERPKAQAVVASLPPIKTFSRQESHPGMLHRGATRGNLLQRKASVAGHMTTMKPMMKKVASSQNMTWHPPGTALPPAATRLVPGKHHWSKAEK